MVAQLWIQIERSWLANLGAVTVILQMMQLIDCLQHNQNGDSRLNRAHTVVRIRSLSVDSGLRNGGSKNTRQERSISKLSRTLAPHQKELKRHFSSRDVSLVLSIVMKSGVIHSTVTRNYSSQ